MPTNAVFSVSIEVDQYRIELGVGGVLDYRTNLVEQRRHWVSNSNDTRVFVVDASVGIPRGQPGLGMFLAEDDHFGLLPRGLLHQLRIHFGAALRIEKTRLQHCASIKRKQLLRFGKQALRSHL